jgi:hypothetical protein
MLVGVLYVTEYPNLGEVSGETPVEPPVKRHTIRIGEESPELNTDTRMVVLWASYPCMVSFVSVDAEHNPDMAWPIGAEQEIIRLVRPNNRMSVKTHELLGG